MQSHSVRANGLPDRAFLVATYQDVRDAARARELLAELQELTRSCGAVVAGELVVHLREPHPRLLVGTGKADEIAARCRELDANVVVFDDALSPAQQRNWEEVAGLRALDRHEVILQIFADRASTREAELQIQLAQAEYLLPRLRNAWRHLSRQQGGLGIRGGEGEKQLEIDHRLLRRSIVGLKAELEKVRKQRAEQRKRRQGVPVPSAAIVGYTNVGKSLLLNQLTGARVLVADKLFATLDPTTRRLALPNHRTLLLTDTVGFVRKLPHLLVEAFKATLEEAVLADLLLHVVDITSPSFAEQLATTQEVLAEIGAGGKEALVVFNKIDLADDFLVRRLRHEYPPAVFVSARTGAGFDTLLDRLSEIVNRHLGELRLRLPPDKYAVLAFLHRAGNVREERFEDDGIYVTVAVPAKYRHELEKYVIS